MTTTPATDGAVDALLTDPQALALAVARGLASAGAVTDWDRGTIEQVLADLVGYAQRVGLPNFTDYSADSGQAVAYWRRVADEQGIQHDGPAAAPEWTTAYTVGQRVLYAPSGEPGTVREITADGITVDWDGEAYPSTEDDATTLAAL